APGPGSMPGAPEAFPADESVKHASARLSMPQVAPKPTKLRVGQRAPARDPVGEMSASPGRETTRCSFAEVIEVTPSPREEAGVSRFECPTCLAVREIKSKSGSTCGRQKHLSAYNGRNLYG